MADWGELIGGAGALAGLYGLYQATSGGSSSSGASESVMREPAPRDASGQQMWDMFMESLLGTGGFNEYKVATAEPATTPSTTAPTTSTLSSLSGADRNGGTEANSGAGLKSGGISIGDIGNGMKGFDLSKAVKTAGLTGVATGSLPAALGFGIMTGFGYNPLKTLTGLFSGGGVADAGERGGPAHTGGDYGGGATSAFGM